MVEILGLKKFLVLSLLVFVAGISSPVLAAKRKFNWDIRYDYKFPDCYRKIAITINGGLPGPTITAVEGDTIIVEVTNSLLTENVAIHWHGIRQIGTPWADGTEAVTQCPILPGDKFVYEFVVDRAGTYMYHAHYGLQMGTGLYGMIIVKPPPAVKEPFHYNFDHHILLTDWYHASTYEHIVGLSSVPFVWVGEPDSILIHGRGNFTCSKSGDDESHCNQTNPDCSPYSISVKPDKTIRLRIGSLATLATLSFEIEDHVMTVVEADGSYVEPFDVKHLYLYSGETYSVLIETNQNPRRNYWMSAKVVSRESQTPNGLAILNYNNDNNNSPNKKINQPFIKNPTTPPPVGPRWNDTSDRVSQSQKYVARKGHVIPPPKTADRVIVLLNTQNIINGKVRWSLNNVSLNLPHTPYLISLKNHFSDTFDQNPPQDTYNDVGNYDIYSVPDNVEAVSGNGIYRLKFNSTVDVILQNANTMTQNISETHPWHLHGHDFWVLGYGTGKFNVSSDPKNYYNLENPIMKNTVPLHPYGWTAFRFQANNPGVWAFHCHIEYHFALGMAVIFEEGSDQLGKLPKSIMGCGKSEVHRP